MAEHSSLGSGLFTETEFKNRGIIKLAPDVLVYIGGNLQMQVIAPVASNASQMSFNDGITTVSVQNNVDPPGTSNATIEVTTPVYGPKSSYWVPFKTDDGYIVRAPVFVPMMEVKIFFKGRYLVDGAPRYYPAFWGFITGVDESYNGGLHKITLACADILHWWSYITVTVHPVPESSVASGGMQKLTVYSTIFNNANPYDIIWQLFQGLGMHEFVTPSWLASLSPLTSNYPPGQFIKVAQGIMGYWRTRFNNLAANLKMYGVLGERKLQGDGRTTEKPPNPKASARKNSEVLSSTQTSNNFKGWALSKLLEKFTVFFEYGKMGEFQQAETMNKLDIATEVKTRSDFEFYQDVNGDFIFKPPSYNMDVRGIPSYEIEPHDIISCNFNTDSEGMITALQVKMPMHQQVRFASNAPAHFGYHLDIDLVQKYGFRFREIAVEYIQNTNLGRQMAVAQMTVINAKALTGSVTIPGRPEMRLGYPIYMRHRDSFHYVKSINHQFDYGGSFNTTLSLEAERKKVYEFGANGNTWSPDPLRDKVFRFTGTLVAAQTEDNPSRPKKDAQQSPVEQKLMALRRSQGSITSMQQGRYKIDERLTEQEKAITEYTTPFTDEAGYKLIGAFPYGRGVNPLDIDGQTLSYQYSKTNQKITAMTVGSLKESDAMRPSTIDLFINKKQEGAVPRYLTTSSIIASQKDSTSDSNASSQATRPGVNDVANTQSSAQPQQITVTTSKVTEMTTSTSTAASKSDVLVNKVGNNANPE